MSLSILSHDIEEAAVENILPRLTLEDKFAIAMEVINGHITKANAARNYNLPKSTLCHIVQVVKCGLKLRKLSGRPPVLDAISINEIRQLINSREILNDNQFLYHFRLQIKATDLRRYNGVRPEPFDEEMIARRTLNRYKLKTNFFMVNI